MKMVKPSAFLSKKIIAFLISFKTKLVQHPQYYDCKYYLKSRDRRHQQHI